MNWLLLPRLYLMLFINSDVFYLLLSDVLIEYCGIGLTICKFFEFRLKTLVITLLK
jgi:hypothetical protein